MMNYKVNINEHVFEYSREAAESLNVVSLGNQKFHILQNNQAFNCELLEANFDAKTAIIAVNGNKYEINIEDEYDQLIDRMGLSVITSQKISDIKAPMPGLIIDVLVEVGQEIEKGTPLLILEAMKMENVLKAEGEGVVKSIEIMKGVAVDKGQILIEME